MRFALLVLFGALALPSLPAQAVKPESLGLDPAALADIAAGKYGNVDSLLILRHGKVAFDRAYPQLVERVPLAATPSHILNMRRRSRRVAMVPVQEAVRRAKQYLPEVFESAAGRELNLEGVELTEDARFWSVTFSYPEGKEGLGSFGRDYKTVRLRAEDGQFFGARNGFLISDL